MNSVEIALGDSVTLTLDLLNPTSKEFDCRMCYASNLCTHSFCFAQLW